MIRINQTPILEEVGYEFGIYLPMLIRRKIDKSILSISEVIDLGIAKTYSFNDYQKINLYIEENCEIDILNAFKDYLKYRNNNFRQSNISNSLLPLTDIGNGERFARDHSENALYIVLNKKTGMPFRRFLFVVFLMSPNTGFIITKINKLISRVFS